MNDSGSYLVVLETPQGECSIHCSGDEFVWDAAARHGISLPAICHQGRCLTCAARLFSGVVDQSLARSYFSQDEKEGFVLPCTGRPRSDLRLRTHQEEPMREFRLRMDLPAPYS
jgi:ferredoxin